MKLNIFNPEHDIALASGLSNFTAPHAGRQLKHNLGWLPALWGEPDSAILVDDVAKARRAISRRKVYDCQLVGKRQLSSLPISEIGVWGWNSTLRTQLLRAGIDSRLLPSEDSIATLRQLSHRRTAMQLLSRLRTEGTVGEAFECTSASEVEQLLSHYGSVVLKAPWSSSGRGVRFLSAQGAPLSIHEGWLRNIIGRQGSVMVEPYYHKLRDFGMEFASDGKGNVTYLGLSLFHTKNGVYKGNILATEVSKQQKLTMHLPASLIENVKEKICVTLGPLLNGKYQGPLGVDMMVTAGARLHPCVEINLRRTMGHVALAATRLFNPNGDDEVRHVMRIEYANNNYKLTIKRL